MPYAHRWMDCQNPSCGSPIQLPDPTIAATKPSRVGWPKHDWKRAFLCFHCGHSYVYSSANIRHRLEATQNPYEAVPFETYCIQFECAEGSCETQAAVYVVADASTSTDAIAGTYKRWTFHWKCLSEYLSLPHPPKPEDGRISVEKCPFPA
jgi:hypothetical protein